MKNTLYNIVLCLLLFASCKEEQTPVVLLVDRNNFINEISEKDILPFEIIAISNESDLYRFSVYENSLDKGNVKIFDSLLSGREFNYCYNYVTPAFLQSQNITLTFEVENTNGENQTISNTIRYVSKDLPLHELSVFTMYTKNSGKPDGFTLSTNSLIHTSSVSDSSLIDFCAYQSRIANLENRLARKWVSKSSIDFIEYNDFNYQEATTQSLKDAYLTGRRMSELNDIKNDDIILFGRGDEPLGVIKFIGVFDEDGIVDDRYVFNIKLIE